MIWKEGRKKEHLEEDRNKIMCVLVKGKAVVLLIQLVQVVLNNCDLDRSDS